ncbi:MAG: hypothetical protein EA385_12025 [Salinarimonadaceae bacterium]|nr:MAG: hypothetical protein EA385_12025 [Salinarimonadaceae bacterium]
MDPFWFTLVLKMLTSAFIVVVASLVVERLGPVMGALVATLPLSAGPNYVYLAMDHGPAFLAEAARIGLQVNVATAFFVLGYGLTAPRASFVTSLAVGFVAWGVVVSFVRHLDPPASVTFLANVTIFAACYFGTRRLLTGRRAPAVPRRFFDLPLRAATVMALVAAVVISGRLAGPAAAGVIATVPLVLTSLAVILHPRIGGSATAQVALGTYPGLLGFGVAVGVVGVTAVPLGSAAALTAGLASAVLWNLVLLQLSRRAGATSR